MELAEAARDQVAFSMRALRHTARRDGGDAGAGANLAVSPLSIHAALVLLGAGARGSTLDEIAAFLGPAGAHAHATLASHVALRVASGGAGGGPTLMCANGVWVDDALRLNAGYARVTADHYRAEASSAPFKSTPEVARSQVNQWISSATAARIRELLPPGSVRGDTQAVLANALYFKGSWSREFEASLTRHGDFHLPTSGGAIVVRVPFMSSAGKEYIVRRAGYKVLRLPYARGGAHQAPFSMYIYLPDGLDGLPGMLDKLSSDPALLESSATMASEVRVGELRVPKFTMSYKMVAGGMLRDLGLHLPFSSFRADFGEMVESPPEPLYVSEVYHECFVEVNEEGTEAAAATAVAMAFGCAAVQPEPEDFVADHPFMFVIREELSGVVVFAGQVINPALWR